LWTCSPLRKASAIRPRSSSSPSPLKAEIGNPHIQLQLAEGSIAEAEEVCGRIGKLLPPADAKTVLVEVENGAADIPRTVRALDEAGIGVESLELVTLAHKVYDNHRIAVYSLLG